MLRARAGLPRLFFLLVFVPLLCVFPYLRGVNNPNEYVRVFTAMSIVDRGTFRIDEPVQLYGWVNDMAKVPSKEDGQPHYFMVKAPLSVYLGLPGYAIFSKVVAPALGHHLPTEKTSQEERLWWLRGSTWALRLFASNLPCFLFLVWFERYLRAFSPDPSIRYAAVAACGLGTNYLAYTHMFASHAQYAAAAFLAFALTERELRLSRGDSRARRPRFAFLAGVFTSACVALEYHALFLAIILSLFGAIVFWRPKNLVAFGLGGLVNVPGVMYFHWRAYGNPLTPGHQMLETQKFAIEHQTGLWGVVWPTWDHLKALSVDPGFGFFGMSPFMWLGLLAVPLVLLTPGAPPRTAKMLRVATFVWFLCGLDLFLVNAGIIEWRAGWTVGPRYLAACPPFFAFGAVIGLERIAAGGVARRAVARGVAGGLALAGVLTIGTVGLLYDTLPESIERPFAQFAVPMIRSGHVPHHVGEWVGVDGIGFWYVCLASMIAAPIVAGLVVGAREERLRLWGARAVVFAVACAAGMAPAASTPEDGSEMWVLHRDTQGIRQVWEPAGRDLVTSLRNEAERYGSRGRGPCLWYRVADGDRLLGNPLGAAADERRAAGVPRSRCPRTTF
jgi:hypothetical protein